LRAAMTPIYVALTILAVAATCHGDAQDDALAELRHGGDAALTELPHSGVDAVVPEAMHNFDPVPVEQISEGHDAPPLSVQDKQADKVLKGSQNLLKQGSGLHSAAKKFSPKSPMPSAVKAKLLKGEAEEKLGDEEEKKAAELGDEEKKKAAEAVQLVKGKEEEKKGDEEEQKGDDQEHEANVDAAHDVVEKGKAEMWKAVREQMKALQEQKAGKLGEGLKEMSEGMEEMDDGDEEVEKGEDEE